MSSLFIRRAIAALILAAIVAAGFMSVQPAQASEPTPQPVANEKATCGPSISMEATGPNKARVTWNTGELFPGSKARINYGGNSGADSVDQGRGSKEVTYNVTYDHYRFTVTMTVKNKDGSSCTCRDTVEFPRPPKPTIVPTAVPSQVPTIVPTAVPSQIPTIVPTAVPPGPCPNNDNGQPVRWNDMGEPICNEIPVPEGDLDLNVEYVCPVDYVGTAMMRPYEVNKDGVTHSVLITNLTTNEVVFSWNEESGTSLSYPDLTIDWYMIDIKIRNDAGDLNPRHIKLSPDSSQIRNCGQTVPAPQPEPEPQNEPIIPPAVAPQGEDRLPETGIGGIDVQSGLFISAIVALIGRGFVAWRKGQA
jgi:hypothetical protein